MSLPLARLDKQYEIVAKIKEGGMGEIYKVRHRLLDEIRVVKVLHPELVGDSELSERFAREARAAIQLRHPNIVQIFDFTVDESGTGLIVMEYIRGSDLKQLIAAPRLPSIALAIEIARQALRALGFLHRHGFVHRDVSPDNLMLSRDVEGRPLVKVIDLGIAKRHGSDPQLTASGIFLGKFRYASPEHFGAQGKDGIEARSDLYTFGLVLYELLTGYYPIQGESMSQLIAGHLFQPPYDFSETDPEGRIPDALRQAVLKILAKEPDERFADADELIAQLDSLQAEHPVNAEVVEESRHFAESVPVAESPVAAADVEAAGVPVAGSPAADADIAERSAALDTLVTQVEELLQSGQLMEADRILFQARESHGPAPELTTARERLDELYHQGVASEVRALISRAEALGRDEDFTQALEVLSKARTAAPAASTLRQDAEAATAALDRLRQEQLERRSIAETERRLLARIQERDFAAAREVLALAKDELGEGTAFEPLRRLLARTAAERIEELIQEAGSALEGDRPETAIDCLGQALELDPDNAWIRDRLEQARAGQRDAEISTWQTTPLSAGLMKAFTDIEGLRAKGDTLGAWRLLRDSIEEYGEIDTFMKLRRLIAEEILNEDEEA